MPNEEQKRRVNDAIKRCQDAPPESFRRWLYYAACSVMTRQPDVLLRARTLSAIARIAKRLQCGTWHAASVHYGTKCHCSKCSTGAR